MPKLIVIREEVTACRECVHRETRCENVIQFSQCSLLEQDIPDASTIPDWCPLPDAPGTSMLHVKAVDGKPVASMAPSCLECSKLILEAGIGWMHLLHNPTAQMLPGAEPVGYVDSATEPLQVRCYSAQHFHWLTAEFFHRIDLRILTDGLPGVGEVGAMIGLGRAEGDMFCELSEVR